MPIQKQAYIWQPDRSIINLNHKPTYEEARKIVGGLVEVVRPRGRYDGHIIQMLVNEEGHVHQLPLNDYATRLYHGFNLTADRNIESGQRITNHTIAGPAIILIGWRF